MSSQKEPLSEAEQKLLDSITPPIESSSDDAQRRFGAATEPLKLPPPKPKPPVLEDIPLSLKTLASMLTYKRPAHSNAEAKFINRFILSAGARRDGFGNHWRTIGQNSPILFSCHTDTVHREEGTQTVWYDGTQGHYLTDKASNCLGADDGVGCWLMLEMIKAKVPGTYIFHTAEEIGGKGSAHIRDNYKERLARHKFAIAFDRVGTSDIITHQSVGRTASDAFANTVSKMLQTAGLPGYKACPHGSFTDTANYSTIISECTNLSTGAFKQHQATEYVDIMHAGALRDALCAADWSTLEASRDPAVHKPRTYSGGLYGGYNHAGRFQGVWHDEEAWEKGADGVERWVPYDERARRKAAKAGQTQPPPRKWDWVIDEVTGAKTWKEVTPPAAPAKTESEKPPVVPTISLYKYVQLHPWKVWNWLFENRVTIDMIEEEAEKAEREGFGDYGGYKH